MRRITTVGFNATDPHYLALRALNVLAFVFQVRSVSVKHFRREHMTVDIMGIRATIYLRKGMSIRRHPHS